MIPPVGAEDADPAEADGLVAADRARIRRGRVDDEPVMTPLLEEVPGGCADGVLPETAAVETGIEEEIDAGVPVLRVLLLVCLDEADGDAVQLDDPAGQVVVRQLAARVVGIAFPPPARDLGKRPDLRDPLRIELGHRSQHDPLAVELSGRHQKRSKSPASTRSTRPVR